MRSPVTLWLAIAYLVFAFGVTLTWYFPRLGFLMPHWLGEWIYPIDKTNLDVLRFAHFLALAALTVRFIPRDWPVLQSRWLQPGDPVRPAFAGNLLPRRVPGLCRAFRDGRVLRRHLRCRSSMSMAGILIMVGTAWLISWYKRVEGRGSGRPKRPPDADLAGGEA